MASIDYQEARKEITKMFSKDSSDRKIVFWYDAPANFKSDISEDSFDCCKVLICDRNEFHIKKIIEHDDVTSSFLVYIPYDKPTDTQNWLLDMLMYSEEYYADTVALTMRRLDLTNTDLRHVIEKHSKFFNSEERNKKLSNYIDVNDNMKNDDFKLAMMSVLVKSSFRSIESILTELVFDNTNQSKYKELVKYGFEDFLWEEICTYYNYEGDLKIESLIKKFMFTTLKEQSDLDDLASFYEQFLIGSNGVMDAKIFVDKIKSDKRYPALQLGIATDLKIDGLLASRDIACVQEADVFECVDNHIIKKIADSLCNGSLDYENFQRVLFSRQNSIWYSDHEYEYKMLWAAVEFFKKFNNPIESSKTTIEYIKLYTDSYYEIDKFYRHICTNYKMIENPIAEFEGLLDRVELKYIYDFLEVIGKQYSDALVSQGSWNFIGADTTSEFYNSVQKNNYKKAFVIISDGMRYEVGQELHERLRQEQILKGSCELSYAISPLPSETRFGMAALLPHKTVQYDAKEVMVDGMPTGSTVARDAVLKNRNSSYAAIRYKDIVEKNRDELRAYMADKSIVYVYHNAIDNAGEHSEGTVFEETETAISDIIKLIKKLFNALQISNFYVTADHGFIYRRNSIAESEKYSNIVSANHLEASKRYLISDDDSFSVPYATEFKLENVSDGQYKVITPNGYDLFKTQGGGQQYVHGGTSLQETIVPIVHVGELSANTGKQAYVPVGVRLKSIQRKITNRSFTLEFEQFEKVEDRKQPVTCVAYLVDENENDVSGRYQFIANSTSDEPDSRITKIRFALLNIDFDRNKRYYLMLRDTNKPDEYICKEQFTIDILGFKMF